jgi:hypothetical protein
MAVRVDDSRHQYAPLRVNDAAGLRQGVVRAGKDDFAVGDRDPALEFAIVIDHARVADDQIYLHRFSPAM